jgi:ketosteroid isomerase-like protein
MTARTPEDIDRLFAERMAAGDVDGVVALYEPGAGLVSFDGIVTTGPGPIREVLARLAAMRPRMSMNLVRVVRSADDFALVYNDWKMSAVDPDGRPVTMEGRAIEISRRQPDGSWLFVLDDPFGRG